MAEMKKKLGSNSYPVAIGFLMGFCRDTYGAAGVAFFKLIEATVKSPAADPVPW